METVSNPSTDHLFKLMTAAENKLAEPVQFREYTILFILEGAGIYQADYAIFPFKGPVLLFATPYQEMHIKQRKQLTLSMLQFHSDFYCIERHPPEVACDGLLFNNIYLPPFVSLSEKEAAIFKQLLSQMEEEAQVDAPSNIVRKAYLQLFLAKAGSIKMKQEQAATEAGMRDELMEQFVQLLDQHYLTLQAPGDYAQLLAVSPNHFNKHCKRYFKKSPSQLIRERMMMQAKKLLHLTRKSIREIAQELNFEDEFYFSRVFKKFTRVSPQTFRNETGIAVMADLTT